MEQYPVGTRIYAVRNETDDQVFVYGFGVYDGQRPIEQDLNINGPIGEPIVIPKGTPNPHMTLDSGEEIWGYECWWAREEKFTNKFGAKEVIPISITADREEAEAHHNAMKRAVKNATNLAKGTLFGTTGDAQSFERNGERYIVVSAFVYCDKDGNALDPELARAAKLKASIGE